MLFRIDADTIDYGIRGDKSDYSDLFIEETQNSVRINADLVLTGRKTIRGWGTIFEEATLENYSLITQ